MVTSPNVAVLHQIRFADKDSSLSSKRDPGTSATVVLVTFDATCVLKSISAPVWLFCGGGIQQQACVSCACVSPLPLAAFQHPADSSRSAGIRKAVRSVNLQSLPLVRMHSSAFCRGGVAAHTQFCSSAPRRSKEQSSAAPQTKLSQQMETTHTASCPLLSVC